ncbi:hypothetical protein CcI156_21915 [Frankia sp. CcI156]|uniref:3-oxoacyl-ACP synthase III family protein n=1 Tax=unclassified Frankia TaxID=2632575 RepID=UPI0003D063E7|nr:MULTISPECIES: ketoacyl-ACP synthase III [unclassified Frankia]ETA00340.1 3-oxoacyl-(acyl-carrier-protein) synthase III [Frankia sp. CcI6]KFB02612.1 3-oxoacyl-(acyl-carrier-protein) synthase III [Frankia sp. Allo2]OHV48859.1 hypothetical protein CgIS1_21645 [Frankia sp. CgIS1]ONH22181.1 hypothetical protein CcI156_21915 [Frankia sp. CcI156]
MVLAGRVESVGFLGTGSSLPRRRVSNADVADVLNVQENWIEARTGVRERRFVAGESNTDLAVGAAAMAIEEAGVAAAAIDAVIVATSTPDRFIPPTAPMVQARLGVRGAVSFDVNAACAGFLYSIEIARSLILSRTIRGHALVIDSDAYSRVLDPADRQTYAIFGDGAGAAVLGFSTSGRGILGSRFKTDGDLAEIAVGGPRLPLSHEQIDSGEHYAKMVGHKVASVVRAEFPVMVREVIEEHDLTLDEIDHVVCHQANPRLVQECALSAGFSPKQLVVIGDRLGNTAAASVPIGLNTAVRDGRIHSGDTVLMMSFGAGMTWGWSLVTW